MTVNRVSFMISPWGLRANCARWPMLAKSAKEYAGCAGSLLFRRVLALNGAAGLAGACAAGAAGASLGRLGRGQQPGLAKKKALRGQGFGRGQRLGAGAVRDQG